MKQQPFIAKYLLLTGVLFAACFTSGNAQPADSLDLYDVERSMSPKRPVSKQNILSPLKIADEHGAVQYVNQDDWEDLQMFSRMTPILARDSGTYYSEGNTQRESLRIVNFGSNKSYIFKKINNRMLLTAIEPLVHNDFTTFYSRFISDRAFRLSRIRFPFIAATWNPDDEDESQTFTENDKSEIPMIDPYHFDNNSYFILLDTDNATMVTLSIIYDGEGAYGCEDRFEKIDGKWMITSNFEGSD